MAETVLLFGLHEELLEHGVVQVRRAYDEPPRAAPHADSHVSRWNIGRRRTGGRGRYPGLPTPLPQHLTDPHNVTDFVALRHFLRKVKESVGKWSGFGLSLVFKWGGRVELHGEWGRGYLINA